MVLALDIAVDSLAVAMVGLGGDVLELIRVDQPRGHSSLDEVVDELVGLATRVRARRPVGDPLIGVGVAVVGVVRREDGLVSIAPNLGWHDVPLGERLADALDLGVPISIANDADLGALAEHRRGAAAGTDDVLFLCGEVGVGGGLIVGGQPFTGAAGYGGEVGHVPVNPAGATCRCGAIGCWETEVGEEVLLELAGHPRSGGRGEVDAVLREAAGGLTGRPGRPRPGRPLAGPRPGRAGQRPQPPADRPGRAVRADPPVRDRRASRTSWTAGRWPRPGRWSGSSRLDSPRMPPCSGRPSWPSSRSWPTRPSGSSPRPALAQLASA